MASSAKFLNNKTKNILFRYQVGYEVKIKSNDAEYDLRAEVPWPLVRYKKEEKYDKSVYPNSKCKTPLSARAIVDLDRNILRYKRNNVMILDIRGTQKLYPSIQISEEVISSLKDETFTLIIRTYGDAKKEVAKDKNTEKKRS